LISPAGGLAAGGTSAGELISGLVSGIAGTPFLNRDAHYRTAPSRVACSQCVIHWSDQSPTHIIGLGAVYDRVETDVRDGDVVAVIGFHLAVEDGSLIRWGRRLPKQTL
jgi:hypothetical protein